MKIITSENETNISFTKPSKIASCFERNILQQFNFFTSDSLTTQI